jgi:hypothetical protein
VYFLNGRFSDGLVDVSFIDQCIRTDVFSLFLNVLLLIFWSDFVFKDELFTGDSDVNLHQDVVCRGRLSIVII